jgi:mannose-6-phosphate isomerase-like protein (cupin superfamily)
MRSRYDDNPSYTTKDGSLIRELMHPAQHGNKNQSLAEAIVKPGQVTALHRHRVSEELYYITQGEGLMTLGDSEFPVHVTDTVCIPPNTAHRIRNTGQTDLHILCCCSPAYAHDDTELLE